MSEQRKAIIIATGMDNTALGKSIRTMVQDVKAAGEQIKRGFMPASMQGDLVAYYRRMGKASGAAFKQGQSEGSAGGGLSGGSEGGGMLGKFGLLLSRFAIVGAVIDGAKRLYDYGANAGKEARQTNWEAEDASFSSGGYQAFLRSVDKTGGDTESAKSGLMKLMSTVGEAREGSEEAAKKFDKWGISLKGVNGEALKGEEIYQNLLEKLSKMHDPTEKDALMLDMFGKSYRGFIDAIDKDKLADAAEWVHKFAPTAQELGSMAKMGEIMTSAAKDNAFTRFWGMIKQVGRGGIGGMEDKLGVGSGREAVRGANLDEQLAALDKVTEKKKDDVKAVAKEQAKSDKDRAAWMKWFEADYAATVKRMDDERAERTRKTLEETQRLHSLQEERTKVRQQEARIDQGNVTMEELAGARFTGGLNADYGKGGKYDLEAGNGPFAGIAQDALLAGKQQQWDIINGNAQFDDKGTLIGGQAFADKQRQIGDENLLGRAGIETPAMKMAAMQATLTDIATSITSLITVAGTSGIVLKDDQ